jgi:hypothetical protein
VRIRQKGYEEVLFEAHSYQDAEDLALRIEMDRRTGAYIDYRRAHGTTFASLVERYMKEVCPGHKSGKNEVIILNSFLTDAGIKGNAPEGSETSLGHDVQKAKRPLALG